MKKWIRKIIIGDEFYYLHDKISMLDNEVRKVRKEIVELRNEILFALFENRSLLKQILEERILVNDIKNNIEVVRVEEEKPVIKRDLPDIPDKEVKIVKSILTQEDVKELFEYRNGDLYWKNDISTGKYIRIKSGTKAGSLCTTKGGWKYRYIQYQKKKYKVSRLIFLMFYGYLPKNITYKDNDSLNTKIENLIEASRSQINSKQKIFKSNKSGYKGVVFQKKSNNYRVTIQINGRRMSLGMFSTIEEAVKVYEEAMKKYYGTFLDKCNE